MKRCHAAVIAGVALLGLTAATAGAAAFHERQGHQRSRIHDGVQSGALTRAETRALRREQRTIHAVRRCAVSDGRIDPREARMLVRAQNRASRHIYRLKHNGRTVN